MILVVNLPPFAQTILLVIDSLEQLL